NDLRRVEVLRHLERVRLRHADTLSVGAPHRQRGDTISLPQPRAARAELLDDADQLVAGREGRLRAAKIRTRAQQGITERHTGGENPDAHLPRTRSGIVLLDHLQDLGATVVTNDDALHASSLLRNLGRFLEGTDHTSPSVTSQD